MTFSLRSFLVLLVIGSPWLAGCGSSDKDDTPAPNPLLAERTAFLTQSTWIQTAATITDVRNGVPTYYDVLVNAYPCIRDNTLVYHTDKTYVNDEGPSRCDSADPQVRDAGRWALNADGSELVVTSDGGTPLAWKLVRCTATEHVIARIERLPDLNITRFDTATYSRQ